MLNFFLVLLHHPLTGLLFVIWHFLSWSEHGTQVFDGFSHIMLTKIGLEAADLEDLNNAWYGNRATAEKATHPLTTTEPAPRPAMADTPDGFTTTVLMPLLEYHGSLYKDQIVPPLPLPTSQNTRYQKTTMMPTPPPQYPGYHKADNIPTEARVVVLGFLIALALLPAFSSCCFACVYKTKVSDRRQAVPHLDAAAVQEPTAEDFPFRLCGCFEDMDICCHAFWCNMTRAADTHHAAGTEKFLNIILFWICSALVGSFVGDPTGMLPGIILALGMTYKRRALKQRLGIKAGSSCEDFLLWWCCGACAVAQEARAIDQAAGVTVKCCCSMRRRASPANLVGPPVVTAAGAMAQPLQSNPQIAVPSFPTASHQQPQLPIYVVPHNVVAPQLSPPSAPPLASPDISPISAQQVHAIQHIQPVVAQVISILPPAARSQ